MKKPSFLHILAWLLISGLNLAAKHKIISGLIEPFSIVFDKDGTLYGVEYENGNRVFSIADEKLTFIAGSKSPGGKKLGDLAEGDGGPANKARFNGMHDLTLHPDGRLFIADTFNRRIRVLNLITKTISTLGDGKLDFKSPYTVDLHPDGNRLLVADLDKRQVVEIDLQKLSMKPLAGNGKKGKPIEGSPALQSPLLAPRAAIYGKDGSIYFASREGHAVRQVTPTGTLRTVVNLSGKKGASGDDGPAVKAQLNGPKHLALDPDGNLVISDDNNQTLRLYKPKSKTLHLLYGTPGKKGDKPSQLNRPHGARYSPDGALWIADSFNHRLIKILSSND
jgi:DNA-binding beta-propeller fold protein YncE